MIGTLAARRVGRQCLWLCAMVGVGLLSGCSTTSLFSPYPHQAEVYRQAIATGDSANALSDLESKVDSKDKLLYRSERGRIYQLQTDYVSSQADFAVAIDEYVAMEEKARLSAGDLFSTGTSLLSNDNAIPYEGYGFERIFLHLFQAFNYLGQGNVEGASVELRRASVEQRQLELTHEQDVEKAQARAEEEQVDIAASTHAVSEFAHMDSLVGEIKNSFQNAYVFYASAVLWEALGDYNRANVDFRKALELNSTNAMIANDVKRTSNRQRLPPNLSTVVILFEDGLVPARQSFQLPIPDPIHGAVHTVAFPYYAREFWPDTHRLQVSVDGRAAAETTVITQVGQLAIKALKEEIPSMVVRQLLRARAKYELQKRMQDRNPLLGLSSTLYSVVSERADQRNWLTLPANAQIMRLDLQPGEHRLQLSVGAAQHVQTIQTQAGRVSIVRVFNPGGRLFAHTYQL